MPETRDQTRSIQDALIIRKLLQEAISYSNIAVYGAIIEGRSHTMFQNVRGKMETALIELDEEAKLRFGDAYNPLPLSSNARHYVDSLDRPVLDVHDPERYMAPKSDPRPNHTVRGGKPATEFGNYGVTHDMDCPGCQDTPFTASPRSETYWSS